MLKSATRPAAEIISKLWWLARQFEGKGLVERHQVVYAALGDAMRQAVHALVLKTLTPAQYQNRR